MNPHQQKKVDIKSLSPEEQRLFRLYGKLPSRSDHFAKHLKERKYFDSGDYAMSKAGKGDGVDTGSVGSQHPVPENIPHLSSPANNAHHGGGGSGISGLLHAHQHQPIATQGGVGVGATQGAGSPIKEASFLNRETSADDIITEEEEEEGKKEVPLGNNTEAIPRR
ncbi:camp-regulated phosphoprotein/endosulfine conserved region-domain-containing protein [Diplogelasinospora grovesii]|uniref:mRNA stability protein n=1 Tax=Diplogelasinospora grovesii TaxID=303347 RepID=A0AAN6S2G4_9PEZI|nr:camp-regulated phosphoprotein/endosulfine conserved region-domain-containing protein [Diplogelasinospora grovesii]